MSTVTNKQGINERIGIGSRRIFKCDCETVFT